MGTSSKVTLHQLLPSKQKKPKTTYTSTVTYGSSVDFSQPQLATGKIIPYLLGKQLCTSPLLTWYGNIKPYYDVTAEQTTTTDDEGNQTVNTDYTLTPKGYKADYQFVLALGPGVHLNTIYYKGIAVWSGDLGVGRTEFALTNDVTPIKNCIFHSGEFDQAPDPYLEAILNEDGSTPVPGFVGMAYIIIEEVDTQELDNIAFEISRYPDPLALGSKNKIDDDLNVISAITDIVTNPWGACGQSIDLIDTANFIAAANSRYAANDGCSLINTGSTTGTDLLSSLLAQCRATIFINPTTNKYQIKLMAFPPDKTGALRIYDNDIISIDSMEKSAWPSVPSNLTIEFTDRSNRYADNSVTGKNLASDSDNNSPVSLSLPTVTNKELATAILARETSIQSSPVQSVSMTTNRKTSDALPGDVIVFTFGKYKYYSAAFVVERRRTQPIDNNSVTLSGYIILYPNNNTLFAVPEDSLFEEVDFNPYPPTKVKLYDLPYYLQYYSTPWNGSDTWGSNAIRMGTEDSSPKVIAWEANKNQLRYTSFFSNPEIYQGLRDIYETYDTIGKLAAAIDKYDNWDDAGTIDIEIDNLIGPQPTFANQNKYGYIFVGNEIFYFDADKYGSEWVYTKSSNSLVITKCKRAIFDSVAESHAVGTEIYIEAMQAGWHYGRIWTGGVANIGGHLASDYHFVGTAIAFGQERFSSSDTALFLDKTSYTASERPVAPYRPAMTKIAGDRPSEPVALSVGASVNISWTPRARAWLAPGVIPSGGWPFYSSKDFNIGPLAPSEPNPWDSDIKTEHDANNNLTAYRVWIEDSEGTAYDCGNTVLSTSVLVDNLTIEIPACAPGLGWLWVDAEFEATAYPSGSSITRASMFKDRLPIEILPASPAVPPSP